jgi:hypothetical protein
MCGLLSAIIDLVLHPFQRHVEVLASENTENGSREKLVKPHYQAPGPKTVYGEQIPNGIGQQTIHESTVDTKLTINVRILVIAKVRKSIVIELL